MKSDHYTIGKGHHNREYPHTTTGSMNTTTGNMNITTAIMNTATTVINNLTGGTNTTITALSAMTANMNITITVVNTTTGLLNATTTVLNTATRLLKATTAVMSILVMDVICSSPPYLENGRVTEKGTYKYNSTAEFQCNSGFYLKGDAIITCLGNNTWSYPRPSCLPKIFESSNQNNIHVQVGDTLVSYPWLVILVAATAGFIGLLLLSCILCCCLRMCGCLRGTEIRVFPRGSLHPEEEAESGNCCCYRHRSRLRSLYSGPKSGNRNKNHSAIHVGEETSESSTPGYKIVASKMKVTNSLGKNAKVLNTWMPHSHPIRNINTSTK